MVTEYWTSSSGGKFHLTHNDDTLCGRLGGLHEDGGARVIEGVLEKRIIGRNYGGVHFQLAYHPDYCIHCLRKAGFKIESQMFAYSLHPSFKVIFQDVLNIKKPLLSN